MQCLVFELAHVLHRPEPVFACSDHYRKALADDDDPQPLDAIEWDATDLRYSINNKNGGKNMFVTEDVVLQSLVMFFLVTRMQYGWGLPTALAELSICPTKESNNTSPMINLWEPKIQTLIQCKKLGPTTLQHVQDSYASIGELYFCDRGNVPHKRSRCHPTSKLSAVHELTEQATIQWALTQLDAEPLLAELASLILKLIWQHVTWT